MPGGRQCCWLHAWGAPAAFGQVQCSIPGRIVWATGETRVHILKCLPGRDDALVSSLPRRLPWQVDWVSHKGNMLKMLAVLKLWHMEGFCIAPARCLCQQGARVAGSNSVLGKSAPLHVWNMRKRVPGWSERKRSWLTYCYTQAAHCWTQGAKGARLVSGRFCQPVALSAACCVGVSTRAKML